MIMHFLRIVIRLGEGHEFALMVPLTQPLNFLVIVLSCLFAERNVLFGKTHDSTC